MYLRRLFVLFILLIIEALFWFLPHSALAYSNGYTFTRSITASSSFVAPSGTSLINFPMLVSFPSGTIWLQTTSTNAGGHIQNPNGFDIIFTSDATGTTRLNYETEQYSSSTGELEAWVQVPSLSSSSRVIYMFYGNSSVTSTQQNQNGTWDTSFKAVWHLADKGATTNVAESTINGNTGTAVNSDSSMTIPGQIGPALDFPNLAAQTITVPNSPSIHINTGDFTISTWFYITQQDGYNTLFDRFTSVDTCRDYTMQINSSTGGWWSFGNGGSCGLPGLPLTDPSASFTYTTWHYLDVVRSSSTVTAYVDGLARATGTFPGTGDSGGNLVIGGDPSGGGHSWDGHIDEFRLANTSRSTDWITTEYNNQSKQNTFYALGSESSATVPTAPQFLSAAPGNAQMALSWFPPSSDGGSPLTQYLVYDRFTGSSTFVLYATTTPSQTTSTVTSLTNGQRYDFEILAQNAIGTSTASNIVSSTPTAPITINSFTALSSTITLGSSSVLSWNISGTVSTTTITGNNLNLSTSTTSGTIIVTPNASGSLLYILTAINVNTSSSATTTILVNVATTSVPTAPQSLSAIPGNAQVSLTWSTPSSNGGSSLTQYLVYDRFTGSSTFVLYATTTPSQTTSTVTSLANGQSYDFEILAQNSIGTSTASNIVSSTPSAPTSTPPAPASAPIIVTVAGSYGVPYIPGTGFATSSSQTFPSIPSPTNQSLLDQLNSLKAQLILLQEQADQSAIFTRDLSFGMEGDDVMQLQLYLIAQDSGPAAKKLGRHGATTFFGSLTRAALIEFQIKNRIKPAIGNFGPMTQAFVNR